MINLVNFIFFEILQINDSQDFSTLLAVYFECKLNVLLQLY